MKTLLEVHIYFISILNFPLGLPRAMCNFSYFGAYIICNISLSDAGVEKRYGISVNEERENRAYITGPTHGIHPLANGGGKGLKTELREVDCKPPPDSVPRVFV